MNLIGVTDFAKRQTKDSTYNHFEGDWDELVALTEDCWGKRVVSLHNPQVHLVPMPDEHCSRFMTSVVAVDETMNLSAHFAPRVEGEDPFIQITASGQQKSHAQKVDIIVYSHEVLAQDNDAPVPQTADHYIVNINAYPSKVNEPMRPITMARNLLNLTGGTKPEVPYTAEEFAEAVIYWSKHCRIGPS